MLKRLRNVPEVPRRLSREVLYKHPWFNLYRDRVRFPGGRVVPDHHLFDFKVSGVAAITEDKRGKVLLVRAYRYVTASIEWEVPKGLPEKGEKVTDTGKREVLEETGYETRGHHRMCTFYPDNGISNIRFHVVRCHPTVRVGLPDPDEIESVRWCSKKDVRVLIERGRIRDGFSLVALLHWLNIRKESTQI